MTRLTLLVVVSSLWPGAVLAQTTSAAAIAVVPPSATSPAAADVAAEPVEATGLAAVTAEDASATRGLLLPSALTIPRGHVVAEVRQATAPLGAIGASVGLVDGVEIGAGAHWIVEEELAYTVSAKVQLVRRARWAFAAHGAVVGNAWISGTIGGLLSLCVDGDRCRALATVHASALLGDDSPDDAIEIPIAGGASIAAGGDGAKLIAEVHSGRDTNSSMVVGYAGVRFPGVRVSFDAGIAFAMGDRIGIGLLRVPMVGMTLRH
jgi:hypothetical protein